MAQESEKKNYIFVYGTLRKGLHNYFLLTDNDSKDSYFIDYAVTKEKYSMCVSGSIPFVDKNTHETQIVGELYLVDDQILKRLDRLEGHPNWYIREKIDVLTQSGKEFKAWLYFNSERKSNIVHSGDFKKYLIELRSSNGQKTDTNY